MDAGDREWLRANRHRMKLGQTDAGQALLDFDDPEVFDAMDDYLAEDCTDLGEQVHQFTPGRWRIVFEPQVVVSQLETLIAQI